jgi:uncharacterized protein with HEPN domain
LRDILAATRDAALLVEQGHQHFVSDPISIRAAKNIVAEVGEAAERLDDRTTAAIPSVPWRAVKGRRDKVVHDYPETDLDVLWDTLVHGMPDLGAAVARAVGE